MAFSLKMKGFQQGQFISADISNGGAPQKARAWAGNPQTTSGLNIIVHRSALRLAPEGMVFEAIPTGAVAGPDTAYFAYGDGEVFQPWFKDCFFRWTFGDPNGGVRHGFITQLPQVKNVRNEARGPIVEHTFPEHGTYTVTCECINWKLGITFIETTTFTVGDPLDTANGGFLPANIRFVSAAGDNTNAPPGATTYTNMGTAISDCANQTDPQWIIGDWGSDFNPGERNIRQNYPTIMFTSPDRGSGTMPILRAPTSGTTGPAANFDIGEHSQISDHELYVVGWHVIGTWNQRTETGNAWGCLVNNGSQGGDFQEDSTYVLIHGCRIEGVYQAYDGVTCQDTGRITIIDGNWGTNWRNFFVSCFNKGTDKVMGVAGNEFLALPDGISDGAKVNTSGIHSVGRTGGITRLAFHQNALFSQKGWSASPPVKAAQPCWRHNTDQIPNSRANFQDNYLEGGYLILQLTHANDNDPADNVAVQNIVVEGNIMIGNHDTQLFVALSSGGVITRNNMIIRGKSTSTSFGGDFDKPWDVVNFNGSGADDRAGPIVCYQNTIVNLMAAADAVNNIGQIIGLELADSRYERYEEKDNLYYQPEFVDPIVPNSGTFTTSTIPNGDGSGILEALDAFGYIYNDGSVEPGTATSADTVRLYELVTPQIIESEDGSPWDCMWTPRPDVGQHKGAIQSAA